MESTNGLHPDVKSAELKRLGQTIRLIRRQSGFTQRQVAEKAGIARTSLIEMEGGARNARTATLVAVLEVLGHEVTISPSEWGTIDIENILTHTQSTPAPRI